MIVGAGSAGCVLAARLSEDPSKKVLLLEAGQPDKKQEIGIPAAFSKLFLTEYDWAYYTSPQPELNDRELFWPRGKMLGGTSSINAMMWVRGVPPDYDGWAKRGNAGWSYDEVVQYFKRAEDTDPGRVDSEHLGTGGPMTVTEQRDRNPATDLFVQACVNLGIPRNPKANAGFNDGVDFSMVTQRRGKRWSTASAYLKPAMKRPNLTVETGAHVSRVIIENSVARGVMYTRDDQTHEVSVSSEVILSGGAINSPQLLMLSGIGPRDHLEDVGIDVLADLPGVGANLSDHLAAGMVMSSDRSDTLTAAETPREMAKYLLMRKGLLTSNVGEAHAFFRSRGDLDGPDLELIFVPAPFVEHGQREVPPGLTIAAVLLQPESRGTIRLTSDDPTEAPIIDPQYLSSGADLATLASGVEKALQVFQIDPLSAHVTGPLLPESVPSSRAEVEQAVRAHAETLYHPAGTCRMGIESDAVVDPELRVRGIKGLRIADTSIMPELNRGHTNAPAVMIGEKASDLIRSAR